MEKSILVILVSKRREAAAAVQKALTEKGCIIKTRLGIHDGVADRCSDSGLIILELVGGKRERDGLAAVLAAIPGVSTRLVELSVA